MKIVGRYTILTALALCCGLTMLAAPVHATTVLWSQDPIDGGEAFISSSGDLFGVSLPQYADDFDVHIGWDVHSVTWWGGFLNEQAGETPGSFNISFFEDDGDAPSTAGPLASEVAVNPSASLTGMLGDPGFGSATLPIYEFTHEFSSPIRLHAGRRYLSIENPDSGILFHWLTGGPYNHQSWFTTGHGATWSDPQEWDFAYQLDGAVIPEPATLTLLGAGIAGLALRRRRRVAKVADSRGATVHPTV